MSQSGQSKKSPFKGSPFSPKPKNKLGAKSNTVNYTIQVVGFAPTNLELLCFNKTINGVTSEGYTYPVRNYVDGEPNRNIPLLEDLGVFATFYQRESREENKRTFGGDAWSRYWIARMTPNGVSSTAETRQESAGTLRNLFMSASYSRYPPKHIDIVDITEGLSMQNYLIDADIIRSLSQILDEATVNRSFANEYPEIASVFFAGPTYPEEAIRLLGYANPLDTPNQSNVPGFVPPGAKDISVGAEEEKEMVDNEEEQAEESDEDKKDENEKNDKIKTRRRK